MQFVIFDLDTSGLFNDPNYPKAEVLGIAALSDSSFFLRYIMPLHEIPQVTSEINKITVRNGELCYKEEEILPTVSQRDALEGLLQYLREFERPCILIAHYCPFHCNFLMRMIIEENLEREFAEVVAGFTDTLVMFKKKFPERCNRLGALTLKTLVAECALSTENVRQARYDVYLLSSVVVYHHFEQEKFVENMMNFTTALQIFSEKGEVDTISSFLNRVN